MKYLQFFILSALLSLSLGLDYAKITLDENSYQNSSSLPVKSPRYLSLSVEWDTVQYYFGTKNQETMKNLLRNLNDLAGKGTIIRVGGNSADYSYYSPIPNINPWPSRFLKYQITLNDFESLSEVAVALDAKVVLGLNFLNGTDSRRAMEHLEAWRYYQNFDHVEAVEIGNEVDDLGGYGMRNNATWGPKQYTSEYLSYIEDFRMFGLLPQLKFFWGATYADLTENEHWPWWDDLGNYIKTSLRTTKATSIHGYSLTRCWHRVPNITAFMSNSVVTGKIDLLAPYSRLALKLGSSLVLGETNSISCGGMPGISDTFAASLWALDWANNLAKANFSGANWHSGNHSIYNFVSFLDPKSGTPTVNPLYLGLYFWAHFSGKGFEVIPSIFQTNNDLIRNQCIRDTSTQAVRCMLIHKDMNSTEEATVQLQWYQTEFKGYAPVVTVKRLLAPSLDAKSGITAAGLSFDGSKDGRPLGKLVVETLIPKRKGTLLTFSTNLPVLSAMILEVKRH